MDSLRRLTSSVFDSHARLSGGGGGGRRHSGSGSAISAFLQGSVGADPASALDLTLITERLLVSGFPVLTPTNKKANETNVDELAAYLEAHHSNHYLIFNLNALDDRSESHGDTGSGDTAASVDTQQRTNSSASLMDQLLRKPQPVDNSHLTAASDARAIAEKVREQMLEFSWERDGMKAHTPPFDLIFRICYSIFAWLSLDSQNVAVVHCQTGKTRSGVVVACYLLFARLADDPIDAFVEFYRKRWEMKALTAEALRSKTPPSIQRFLASFHELIEVQKPPNDKPLLLKAIICRALPVELQPCIQIWDDYKMIFCTDSILGNGGGSSSKDAPVLDWNGDDGFLAILWENGITLDGGFSILCSFGDEYDNGDEVDASSRVLFRYADSTWFLNAGLVTLTKGKLDMMKQYEHGFDDDMFSVDLVLHENSVKVRKNYVRLDYTGNNAVRQGLIEITKHHLVLPDPAMHSNFIRMGFGETPTTFALQRSQNTPNVALDLLHSEGLAACFANESSPGKEALQSAGTGSTAAFAATDQMPAGEPTMNPQATALRRQTTAEIVAMQSQRSRYSTPSAVVDASCICHVCKEDDYMMRPQIVHCTGKCDCFYHTTCVGLRKIPFGLTTLSDRTNHGVYVKKFFSAWECDSCALLPSAISASGSSTAVEIPAGMTLVSSLWASSYASSAPTPGAQSEYSPTGTWNPARSDRTNSSSNLAASAFPSAQPIARAYEGGMSVADNNQQESESVKLDKLRDFLQTSGVSVEDLLRAATTANVSIAPAGENSPQNLVGAQNGGAVTSRSSPSATHDSHLSEPQLVNDGKSLSPERVANESSSKYAKFQPPLHLHQSPSSKHQSASDPAAESGLGSGEAETAAQIKEATSPAPPAANGFASNSDLLKQIKARSSAEPSSSHATPPAPDLKSALLKDILVKRKMDDTDSDSAINIGSSAESGDVQSSKYEMMLKRGVPFDAVQNCMVKDGVDPSTLRPLDPSSSRDESSLDEKNDPADAKVRLQDVDEFKNYFNMLRLGCQKEAVKQKLIMDGLDPIIFDLGPDAIYEDVKFKITTVVPVEERSRLQDDIKSVREPKSQRSVPENVKPSSEKPGPESHPTVAEEQQKEKTTENLGDVLLKDHEVYAKYFKMLKMGLPEDAVRHKIKSEGADERALELGGDAPLSKLMEKPDEVKLGDDSLYSKYFKMLKMGLPEGAVRHKMITDGVDPRALELGAEALVSALTKTSASKSALPALKPKQRRKKLHWQAISEDRLSSINQQTIWEDKGDDDMEFDMDMDELESLFFANNDANNSSSGSGKKKGTQGKTIKRKQSVTLVDGKRAMNAAISLARVKLSYREIAQGVSTFDPKGLTLEQLIGINEFLPTPEEVGIVSAYTGDIAMLGEAEKFILEISKVTRYASRMECLVFKLAFPSQSAELTASYTNMFTACEEVKGSRLLKVLLSMVLKLGNTLNGSGDDNGIRGFTVDSLLRLGHTKAVNQKTTVLHYLVRIVKKNHPQVLDFQDELKRVPLAARESFDTITEDFSKLQTGYAKLQAEITFLQKQATSDPQSAATASSMQVAAAIIETQMQKLEEDIKHAREEVSSVFDYFGEDPNKNATDFFTTLTSFCTAFEAARKEVDAADEAALRAERLKLRRSGSVTARPQLKAPKDAANAVTSAFQLRIRERAQSERDVTMRQAPSSPGNS